MVEACDGCGTTSRVVTYWCSSCSADRRHGAVLRERLMIANWLMREVQDGTSIGLIAHAIQSGAYAMQPTPTGGTER